MAEGLSEVALKVKIELDSERVQALEDAAEEFRDSVNQAELAIHKLRSAASKLQLNVSEAKDSDKLTDDFETFYNEDTLHKVHAALEGLIVGGGGTIRRDDVTNIINALQNYGILFRERA